MYAPFRYLGNLVIVNDVSFLQCAADRLHGAVCHATMRQDDGNNGIKKVLNTYFRAKRNLRFTVAFCNYSAA